MNKNIVHEINNYLHQIISNAEYISQKEETSEYADKIKNAAYSIDAIMTDITVKKLDIGLAQETPDLGWLKGLNVLIVDDMLENIEIMESIFTTLSCNTLSAQSGEEAIEIFKNGFTPKIVCMDMIMPGIDGSQTTTKLKEMSCSAYFIAISALKNQPNSVVSNFDCWIPKPFTLEHIYGALSDYNTLTLKEKKYKSFKIDVDDERKMMILYLAKNGKYSELERLINTLQNSPSKEFLSSCLKKIDFNSIINSIVSS